MDYVKYIIPTAVGTLVFMIIFILTCWDTVDITKYGLKCNRISKKCESYVYDSGRYFVGPIHYFVEFPSIVQSIDFSEYSNSNKPLQTRTAEGLALVLHITFQYQLQKGELYSLFQNYNLFYEQTFIKIARDIILQSAGNYQAPQYWQERQKIVNEMKQQLNTELLKAHANCKFFALLKIDLPDQYEQSIVQTQVETQYKTMKEFEKQTIQIQQELDVMISENNSKIQYINAQADADAFKIKQEAQSKAIQFILQSENQAYQKVKSVIIQIHIKYINIQIYKYIYIYIYIYFIRIVDQIIKIQIIIFIIILYQKKKIFFKFIWALMIYLQMQEKIKFDKIIQYSFFQIKINNQIEKKPQYFHYNQKLLQINNFHILQKNKKINNKYIIFEK
ncbi:spfh domain band 7 family protein [Ichthyophthirius multifiliis]|uniref:Spfh domain band 7 family protein n=1 Tax=Ichthyophthirius multifiliis TaxID=5932 RepID=G0QKM0_ICHMU|nr:spfh domain band 7 family protein [Ichthyophthirius multifiliis]EGR34238.1 spfh domain band 7 family protein [Ichthyophthirius multifiliis]|eukprot:XP_004039542.1 spfh domain band 7 family protein [Ichthyophthirius multifiliis]